MGALPECLLTLHHEGCGYVQADAIWHGKDFGSRHRRVLGIAEKRVVRHAVALLQSHLGGLEGIQVMVWVC